jgi:hypothetical protein
MKEIVMDTSKEVQTEGNALDEPTVCELGRVSEETKGKGSLHEVGAIEGPNS